MDLILDDWADETIDMISRDDMTNDQFVECQKSYFEFLVPLMFPFFFDLDTILLSDAIFYITIMPHIPPDTMLVLQAHMLDVPTFASAVSIVFPGWIKFLLSKLYLRHPIDLAEKQKFYAETAQLWAVSAAEGVESHNL